MKDPVEQVVQVLDESTMLGAAWDCLSDAAKARFRNKIKKIIDDAISPPEQSQPSN